MARKQINYHHLYYFYVAAREGGVGAASQYLHVSPQTVSGQIIAMEAYLGHKLFERQGKRMLLNDRGKLVFSYAEDIFALGAELADLVAIDNLDIELNLYVGVVDVVPKVFAFELLEQAVLGDETTHLVTRSGNFETLISEMAVNKLDLIISDRPIPQPAAIKAFSHRLGESPLTFFIAPKLLRSLKLNLEALRQNFPLKLDGLPLIIPGDRSALKHPMISWFERIGVEPHIVAEFDDTMLMKFFGQQGHGVFCAPTIIEQFVVEQFSVEVISRTTDVKETFYGISRERKIKHPAVQKIFDEANRLFQK